MFEFGDKVNTPHGEGVVLSATDTTYRVALKSEHGCAAAFKEDELRGQGEPMNQCDDNEDIVKMPEETVVEKSCYTCRRDTDGTCREVVCFNRSHWEPKEKPMTIKLRRCMKCGELMSWNGTHYRCCGSGYEFVLVDCREVGA